MNQTALIFGAGKTGRGFAAHLAFLGGYDVVLIDKNEQLISDLKKQRQYYIEVFGNKEKSGTIEFSNAYDIKDELWHEELVKTSIAFTAVFGNNLEELSEDMAVALNKRYMENPDQVLTIITCENWTNAAHFLKDCIVKNISHQKEEWLLKRVGFSEGIIFKTCLNAGVDQSPLTIRAQDFFNLPCDAEGIKEPLNVYGLKPLKNFRNQLKRKIYTYNCINAVITYLGARKRYTQLYDAGNDNEILQIARKAANETSRALVTEFGFDPKEQEEWVNGAFAKFSDRNIPDPIERNGADPVRKLSREDRLIGPALLALKHGIYPEGLLEGIIASFDYFDQDKNFKIAHFIKEKGIDSVLENVCGLLRHEELFKLIKGKYASHTTHVN